MKKPRILELADGRPISSGKLTHLARMNLAIALHSEPANLLVTSLGHYPIILGIKWLQIHDVSIRWATNSLIFNSPHCRRNCLNNSESNTVVGNTDVPELRAERPLVVESSTSTSVASSKNPSPETVRFNRPGRLNQRVQSKESIPATSVSSLPVTASSAISSLIQTPSVPTMPVSFSINKNPSMNICMPVWLKRESVNSLP